MFKRLKSIRSLEKNPTNGGTPAIEKRDTVIKNRKKKFNFTSIKENKVLKSEITNCFNVQKIVSNERL